MVNVGNFILVIIEIILASFIAAIGMCIRSVIKTKNLILGE